MAPRPERRLAAILAADVAGYSRLMGADEAGTRARFVALLDGAVRPAIAEHRGRLVKTMGDGFLVEFASVVDAVQCAADIQAGAAARDGDAVEETRMLLRIGIHLGDVMVEGDDIHGDGVNIAARLEALAEPGGICVSDMVRAGVRGKLALDFADTGEHSLKNIAEPVRVFRVALDAPSKEGAATEAIFRRPAVAVLPFENLSGDPEQDYFADGLTEDVITALSLWRSFPVIARNSTFAYKGRSPDIREVGEALGARYVVEGSVRKSGNRMRVTAQLINAETGHHVWAERYDRDVADIFDLQDELTERIAATVAPEIERADQGHRETNRSRNLDAWECVQKGIEYLDELSEDGIARGRAMFERAARLDPAYCRVYTELARSYHRELFLGRTSSREAALNGMFEAARKAVAVDDSESIAHYVLAQAHVWAGDLGLAEAEARKAVGLNPSNASARAVLGVALCQARNFDQGIAHLERAIRLNPKHPRVYIYLCHLADAELNLGRFDAAAEHARAAVDSRSDYLEAHVLLAAALGYAGAGAEAAAALAVCAKIDPEFGRATERWRRYRDASGVTYVIHGLRKAGWEG